MSINLGPVHNYSVGDVVDVYQKPMTKEELEGKATIVKLLDTDDCYRVIFGDEEQAYNRFIY